MVICVQAGFNNGIISCDSYGMTSCRPCLLSPGSRGIWIVHRKRWFIASTEDSLARRCRKGGGPRKWSFFFSPLVGILETPFETFYCFYYINFYSGLYIRNNWTNYYLSHKVWVIGSWPVCYSLWLIIFESLIYLIL